MMKFLSNGAPHGLFWYIGHHTKAVYKCTISRYVKSRKYGPYGGTYTNIAKTASASLYFHCYNPISYSGHPRGSKKYRLAKMWGGGCTRVISGPRPIWYWFELGIKMANLADIQSIRFRWYSFVFARTQSRLVQWYFSTTLKSFI